MRALLLSLLSLAAAAGAARAEPPDLTWLAGDWIQCGDTRVVEERWLAAAPGELVSVGLTRNLKTGKYDYEFVRIGKDGDGWAFYADPSGQDPAKFPAVEVKPGAIAFENPAHDFPTRIAYWREGETLNASIEGPGGKGKQVWRYRRNGGEGCG